MKTTAYFLILILGLIGSTLTMASGNPVNKECCSKIEQLAPVTPSEATFDDVVPAETTLNENLVATLAPSTPKEADFEETIFEETINVFNPVLLYALAPTAPAEADFE